MAAGKLTIGYILSLNVAENVFMGGGMVTDSQGMPLEFRYTEPVRATKLQRVLYGEVLEKYIQCDVIAGNIAGRLEQKPDLIIVSDANLLPAFDVSKHIAATLTIGRTQPLKEYGAQQDLSETEFYLQLAESGSPVRVRISGVPGATGVARKAEIARILTECGRSMDLQEPLARVETAVKMLWEEASETPATT
jgi:hypothetical protein